MKHINHVREELVTHYIKIFPDRYKVIKYKNPYSTFQGTEQKQKTGRSWLLTDEEKQVYLADSIQRSKTRISDLIICNEFDMFVTFTFNCRACVPKCTNDPCICDKKTCKRYDLAYCIRTQKAWYNNQTKKYGRFDRLQVMELHKKESYHFHALFKGYKGPLKKWKKDPKDGRMLYNLSSNKKGWTTVKKIYDVAGASSYMKKYLTKDMPLFPGKKRYWTSQGLLRPIIIQDEALMEQILSNPDAQVYKPKRTAEEILSGVTTNLDSITTLIADNRLQYHEELNRLKFYDALRRIMGLKLPVTAHSSVNNSSSATESHSITEDSTTPGERRQ